MVFVIHSHSFEVELDACEKLDCTHRKIYWIDAVVSIHTLTLTAQQ